MSEHGGCVTIRPGMQALTESDSAARLSTWIERVARPIEFAIKDQFAHLETVKNLGSFVSAQVCSLLTERLFPPAVEAHVLALRDLFVDFQPSLAEPERRRRLRKAAAIVQELRALAGHSPQPAVAAGEQAAWREGVEGGERQDLHNVPIRFVKGVGPKRTQLLRRWKIETVEDALWTVPWRYEDRSVVTPIGNLVPGLVATICGTITQCRLVRTKNRRMSVIELHVQDRTGRAQVLFFNQPYLEKILVVGVRVMTRGRVTTGAQGWTMPRLEAAHYEVIGEETEAPLHIGRIVPIYHETKGWSSRHMRALEKTLLDTYARHLRDCLPASLRARRRLIPIRQALYEVHFPNPGADIHVLDRGVTPAHRRLAFEELFLLQLALAVRRRSVQEERKGLQFDLGAPLLEKGRRLLPFRLTAAQERVIREIFHDMLSSRPMNRLVQGDVGSGKT
ncbi:MAG: OB-fold nucleic acid binding domain-containing protein, partial [Nitrospira sp.]|nr:OB-fold nucleic acid binding domain-containing protein [Nitrospira sp.]